MILAIVLGIKHSLDADHVVAISGMLTRSYSVRKTITLSTAWAMGHMLTASIITFILYFFKEIVLEPILQNFELIVALMLIIIGVLTLAWEFDIINFGKHSHGHKHESGVIHNHEEGIPETDGKIEEYEHAHIKVLDYKREHATISGIGVIHGLASNDELLLLLTLTLGFRQFSMILLGILIFTIGVVLGMVLYGTVLTYTVTASRREQIIKIINVVISILAITYAFYILLGGETINLFPFIQ